MTVVRATAFKNTPTRYIDAVGGRFARRIPGAKLAIYKDAGHGGIFQHHESFVAEALAFLA